jgi:hypothetical protein
MHADGAGLGRRYSTTRRPHAPRHVGDLGDVSVDSSGSVSVGGVNVDDLKATLQNGSMPSAAQFAKAGLSLAERNPQVANAVSSMTAGISTGAAIGSLVPVVGTAVGAVVGGVVAAISLFSGALGGSPSGGGTVTFPDGRTINYDTYPTNVANASQWIQGNPGDALSESPTHLAKTFNLFLSHNEFEQTMFESEYAAWEFTKGGGPQPTKAKVLDDLKYSPLRHAVGAFELLMPLQIGAATAILAQSPGNTTLIYDLQKEFPLLDPSGPTADLSQAASNAVVAAGYRAPPPPPPPRALGGESAAALANAKANLLAVLMKAGPAPHAPAPAPVHAAAPPPAPGPSTPALVASAAAGVTVLGGALWWFLLRKL